MPCGTAKKNTNKKNFFNQIVTSTGWPATHLPRCARCRKLTLHLVTRESSFQPCSPHHYRSLSPISLTLGLQGPLALGPQAALLLLLLPSHFSRVRLCATPSTAAHQAPPVPGILWARTLEWVAIFFSDAWKWKGKWSRSVVSDSSRPHGLQPTRLLCSWDSPGKSTGVGCHCLLQQAALDFSFLLLSLICPPGGALGQVFNNTTALCRSSLLLRGAVCVRVLNRFSRVRLFTTHWTAAHQAPLSMGFSRQENWSGSPCLPPVPLPIQFSRVVSESLRPHGRRHSRFPCPSATPGELAQTPVHPVCDAIWISSSVVPFSSCLQSSSASGSFPVS